MRLLLAFALIAIAAASCGAPSPGERIVVQNEPVQIEPAKPELPAPVIATLHDLKAIAAEGSTWDMARLARGTPGFRSNDGGLDHSDYWYLKYRTGDWPMEHLGRILEYEPAVVETEGGLVYVWPYMAVTPVRDMTPKVRRDIETLLGEDAAQTVSVGGAWPGYRLGIAEDGTWLYFYTGAD